MPIHLHSALEFDLPYLVKVFNRGFEGYFVPLEEGPEDLAARLRYDTIDLALSQVALLDEHPVGIIYVAVRGWQCRIAGMGVAMEARRQGVGRRLMEAAIEQSRAAGLRRMVLEVIEQNEPAAALYRDLGFESSRRLVGYALPRQDYALPRQEFEVSEPTRRDAKALEEIDPREVSRQIAIEAPPDLPWQLAAETLSAQGTNLVGVQLHGKAFALIQSPESENINLHALLVPRKDRRSGWGKRMFQALATRHGDQGWRIPARIPEDLAAPFLRTLGFQKSSLTQLEMHLPL